MTPPRRRRRHGGREGYSPQHGSEVRKVFGVVPRWLAGPDSIAARTVNDFAATAHNAPLGLYALGKAMYTDVRYEDFKREQARRKRLGLPPLGNDPRDRARFMLPHTRRLLEAMGRATYADFRHPLRHPGNTLLTGASVATGGALAGARVSGAVGAAREASRLKAARIPRVAMSRKTARELDPHGLGVEHLRRDLKNAEPKHPARAAFDRYRAKPTMREKALGVAVVGERSTRRGSKAQAASQDLDTKRQRLPEDPVAWRWNRAARPTHTLKRRRRAS